MAESATDGAQFHDIETNKSDVKKSLPKDLLAEASRWGLDLKEWKRYLEIKNGPRGFWSPDLDPIGLLAVEARDDNERRHYAKMYAIMQDERISDELVTDRYRREWVMEMYADKSTADASLFRQKDLFGHRDSLSKMSLANPSNAIASGDRFLFFVDISITSQSILTRLMPKVGEVFGVTLDIYVVGANSDAEIHEWAKTTGVDAELVNKKTITLNHDGGTLKKLSSEATKAQLFLERDGKILRVSATSF
jgi:integrating conjugative element protein (TIGR03759 family)